MAVAGDRHSLRRSRLARRVLAVPATMAAASSSAPIPAVPPVASTKRQAASTFGPIEPFANSRPRSSDGVARPIGRAAGRAPVALDGVDVGEQEQEVGLDALGEQLRREVLVDHGLDAAQVPAPFIVTGMPPPPVQTTIAPVSTSIRIADSSTIRSGSGDATTRRK